MKWRKWRIHWIGRVQQRPYKENSSQSQENHVRNLFLLWFRLKSRRNWMNWKLETLSSNLISSNRKGSKISSNIKSLLTEKMSTIEERTSSGLFHIPSFDSAMCFYQHSVKKFVSKNDLELCMNEYLMDTFRIDPEKKGVIYIVLSLLSCMSSFTPCPIVCSAAVCLFLNTGNQLQ